MDMNDFKEFRKLVEAVMYSDTKKESQKPIERLQFMAAQMKGDLNGYAKGILKKVVNYAKEASGRVKNKDHWISLVEENWYLLKSEIESPK
jgi:hypothetical protein